MYEDLFEIWKGDTLIASHLTLKDTNIFVKALFEEYFNEIQFTIKKMEHTECTGYLIGG